ncbi:DUF4270 domain-containing protein [Flavobacterium sp.]|uniref:DUF4270 domain-containing protein n=1 Tax=Flavobacterium sp. TaxID=239 RepID=UPI00286E397D|nr:DUF4270 domain-containing protein [Flavobacterium sp.]
MKNTIFLKKLSVVLIALLFASCDKDYNSLGSDIVGNENFTFENETFDVISYNQGVGAVETGNLEVNSLGIRNSAIFGNTKSNFVTQLSLATSKPVFGANIEIDSVILSVPYFSKELSTETSGRKTYKLDSIYGTAPINLKVYENGYYLTGNDPSSSLPKKYYSNQDSDFNGLKIGAYLNDFTDINISDNIPPENIGFTPDKRGFVKYKIKSETQLVSGINYEIKHTPTTDVESRAVPSMRMHLNKVFFKNKITDALSSVLDNNNAFQNHFRGLYFDVDDALSGTMMSLNFNSGTVTVYYKEDKITEVKTGTVVTKRTNERPMKTLVMNMAGNKVNLLKNTNLSADYTNALATSNRVVGDKKLYLKGGEGSKAFLEIKDSDIAYLKSKKVLINQATLTFTIDNSAMINETEPERIYVFDADNNRALLDYVFDQTQNVTYPKLSKSIHDGIITKNSESVKKGIKYVVNITEHINNLVNKDSTNVRLGVVLTEGINLLGNGFLKTPVSDPTTTNPNRKFDRIPRATVMSPLGTVLFGSVLSTDLDFEKRIKFEVYYTKPN